MVRKSTPDEAEALVIIGKQRAKYEIKVNDNSTVRSLDIQLQNVMLNQFSVDHELSEFIPPEDFIIKMFKIDMEEIDYDDSKQTIPLFKIDGNKKLKDIKEDLNIDNIQGYEYIFYIQKIPDKQTLDVINMKRSWNIKKERILDDHNLKNCEKTNCANDENDELNDVDIKNSDATSVDTNEKDIFCTAFPEYSVKKQESSSIDSDDKEPSTTKFIFPREDRVPRGLVNQAMTCYLNSLLQALYMTPEFRNALYKWEYVESPDNDENMSIPFQLQKLFLNLQTAEKSSVETTSLTKSFGWDSSEAWQQHDIQELCRVMFDALEHQFKNTEQANLINQLYEGKMIDYVKCLECNTEKTREDTFLDIPLPVRPFNSNVAYNSIEDALKGFVKYELLEGNNQYHCEKCDKKCDAHKGLKFNKFPYLVTLHLKRFDFDCHSFHRIKLNDKVTFPETLDLNPFIDSADSLSGQENNCQENDIKLDNGVSPDECLPCDENATENIHGNEKPNDEKGIDATNDNCVVTEPKGPYVYELFAIMIHSGSASGGHYYAYIKDFTTQEWFCYNDQSVSRITNEDIKKTYGGGPARTTYYSSAYNTSTNAYMLMYRQIDPKINAVPMQKEDFPDHIKKLLPKLKEENSNSHRICNTMSVYCYMPRTDSTLEAKVPCRRSSTWGDVVAQAQLHFEDHKRVDTSLINVYEFDYDTKSKLSPSLNHQSLVNPGVSSVIIELPPVSMTCELSIIEFDVDEKRAMGPIETKSMKKGMTIGKLKKQIADSYISWNSSEMVIAKKSNEDFEVLKDDVMLSQLSWGLKLYVGNKLDPRPLISDFPTSKFCELCRTYSQLIYIQVRVPDIKYEILAESGILPLEEPSSPTQKTENDCTEAPNDLEQESKVTLKETDVNSVPSSTLQLTEIDDRNTPEQSNSEDSSLSDSDRTLIAEPPENNEDEDEVLRVYQKDIGFINSENETCYGLWISQVSDIESKLKKVVESLIQISSEYIQIVNICSAKTYPPQYSVYSVDIERKPQDDELKFRFINLYDSFYIHKPTYDKNKFEVIMLNFQTVKDLKNKIMRVLTPDGYKWVELWTINNHLEEDDRVVYMKEEDLVSQYHRPISGRKRGFDHRTIDVVMYWHRSDSLMLEKFFDSNTYIPLFIRRVFPNCKKYGDIQLITVDRTMTKNFADSIADASKIPKEYLLFITFSSLKQLRSLSSTFSKNLWTELLFKSKDQARWSTTVPILPSVIDVIIYRDSREEYPSDINRTEYEIFQDRPKMRKNYRDYSLDNHSITKDYTDREIRRTSIRSSMSRPEKGIKIQVSPNK